MMGHGVPALLITAAVGYWVLTLAAKEKEQLRKVGNVVGLLIIVVSLLGAACKIYYQVSGKNCPPGWGKRGGMACPMTGKPAGMMTCPAGHPGCTMNCPPENK